MRYVLRLMLLGAVLASAGCVVVPVEPYHHYHYYHCGYRC